MRIRVKMFAILKDRSGVNETDLELASGTTVSRAMEEIAGRYRAIADLLPRIATAVNLAYAQPSMILHDGDELALIPPVSGGCG
ncbi:MAG: MoaD/ThiS family protein [Planctomycetota bacterium]|nr:MoaD/ThiS family protein [Planctomycetota bacterium]